MAFTIPEFITEVQAGHPVQVLSSISIQTNNTVRIEEKYIVLNGTAYDLGVFHTSKQILDSYTLRAGINSGQVVAEAGVVSISVTPVDVQP